MKKFTLLLLLALPCIAQTVSNIHFDGVGDSSARVHWNVSSAFTLSRVRYGTGACTSGTGGYVQGNTSVSEFSGGFPWFDMTQNISGLAPSTTYNVCPEVSDNGGTTWSSGVSASLTTNARTSVLPIAPVTVPTTFPAQAGSTLNVLSNCSNLQTQINAAVAGQIIVVPAGTICSGNYTLPTPSNVISFAPSAVTTSTSTLHLVGHGLTENEAVVFSTAGADANCLPGMMIYGANTNDQGFNCDIGGGWRKGVTYYVHVVDANNVQILGSPSGNPAVPGWLSFTCQTSGSTITFSPTWQTPGGLQYAAASPTQTIPANSIVQFYSAGTLCGGLSANTNYYLLTACAATVQAACVTQVSTTSGGSAVTLTSTGTGTQTIVDQGMGTMYIAPKPPALGTGHDIVITTSGNLPPAGVRTSPAWDTQNFHFQQTTLGDSGTPVLNTGVLASNWIIQGAILDTPANNTDYLTTVDPRPYYVLYTTNMDSSNIIFDRCRLQGPGYPSRLGASLTVADLDGANVGWINSDLRGIDAWAPWYTLTGFSASVISNVVTITGGTYWGGAFTSTLGTTTITLTSGGSVTGNAYVYFAMDGTLKLLPPTGTTWTCVTASGPSCTVLSAVASPSFPVSSSGGIAGAMFAIIALQSGTITGNTPYGSSPSNSGVCPLGGSNYLYSCIGPYSTTSIYASEGPQIISGLGPGPYVYQNNWISGTGDTIHFSDIGGAFAIRGDYTVTGNTFDVPAYTNPSNPATNGLHYHHRQSLEWKAGQRINVSGNIFEGNFSDDTSVSIAIAFTPRQGGATTDVNVSNNYIPYGNGGFQIPEPVDTQPVSIPSQRTLMQNNLITPNGWANQVANVGVGYGWMFLSGYGSEDVTIDHNTGFNLLGSNPAILANQDYPIGGLVLTNNHYFFTGNGPMVQTLTQGTESYPYACGGETNFTAMQCNFTSGPGNPSYTIAGNVIVPSWSNTQTQTGFIGTATVNTALTTAITNINPVVAGASQPANVALVDYVNQPTDLRLAGASPYIATATDGTQAGAQIDVLNQALGTIQQARALSVTTSGFTASAYVPVVSGSCYVGYSTTNSIPAFTWTAADTTASRQRNIAVTGLTTRTVYYWAFACAGSPMTAVQELRVQ